MSRRVFLSYDHRDQISASGFDVGAHRDLIFRGRHLADVVGRRDAPLSIEEELGRSTVTLVLIGPQTARSDVVNSDIELTLERGKGLVGLLLDPGASPPELLEDAGAEILNWKNPADIGYLSTALEAAARSAALLQRVAKQGTGAGKSCARPTARLPE